MEQKNEMKGEEFREEQESWRERRNKQEKGGEENLQ
jgi:hypothetical protein